MSKQKLGSRDKVIVVHALDDFSPVGKTFSDILQSGLLMDARTIEYYSISEWSTYLEELDDTQMSEEDSQYIVSSNSEETPIINIVNAVNRDGNIKSGSIIARVSSAGIKQIKQVYAVVKPPFYTPKVDTYYIRCAQDITLIKLKQSHGFGL